MSILTAAQVASLCHEAGFAGEALVTAVAVAKAESGFDTDAVGDTTLTDAKWGPSVGLFQVRCLNAQRGTGGIRDEFANPDPQHNARSAWAISAQGTNFGPWSVFGSGAYRRHLADVRPACAAVDPTVPAGRDEPVLQLGDAGPSVEDLQRSLSRAGFPCAADGDFGGETRRAVLAFQASRQLDADGVVGPATWSALRAATSAVDQVLHEGDSGPAVAELQRRLTGAGFPCAPDGTYGPMTSQAVRALQAARGLPVDGVVGPATWSALLGAVTIGG